MNKIFWPALILSITLETLTITLLRVTSLQARRRLRRWQRRLGLTQYAGCLEATHPLQVTGPDGIPGCQLVGVVVENASFRLIHTRQLTEHDIIHELLHVLWPDAGHEQVEEWTDRLWADPALAEFVALRASQNIAPQTEQPSPLVKEFYP